MPFKGGFGVTTIVLVRHGHTAFNKGGPEHDQFRGTSDIPLDDRGLLEAEATARAVATRWQPAAVYSSPLQRAMKTADAIARQCGLSPIPEPALLDINYGSLGWTGLTVSEAALQQPRLVDAWLNAPEKFRAPDGDSLQGIRRRVTHLLKRLALLHNGETIVLVSHDLVIRLALLAAMGLPTHDFWRIRQDTCAINVLQHQDGVFFLALVNDTGHIQQTDRQAAQRR
jgi:broad specificity phosphatase PhoE